MQRFTSLRVWKQSHELALAVYRSTRDFPQDERFGLTSQLRRSAVSVAANIVEGSKRISRQDFGRFLNIAEGSLAETEYLLMLSRDLGYLSEQATSKLLSSVELLAKGLHTLREKVAPDERR